MRKATFMLAATAGAISLIAGAAFADSAPAPASLGSSIGSSIGSGAMARFAIADAIVLAIRPDFAAEGGHVRLVVYDSAESFLEAPRARMDGVVNEDGVALLPLRGLKAGDYSFVAYFDKNGDGKLNRNVLGKPKEPFIFSNNIRPKLKKPTFEETKVPAAPGEVIEMTLKD